MGKKLVKPSDNSVEDELKVGFFVFGLERVVKDLVKFEQCLYSCVVDEPETGEKFLQNSVHLRRCSHDPRSHWLKHLLSEVKQVPDHPLHRVDSHERCVDALRLEQ